MQSREIKAQPSVEVVFTAEEANAILTFQTAASCVPELVKLRQWKAVLDLATLLKSNGARYEP